MGRRKEVWRRGAGATWRTRRWGLFLSVAVEFSRSASDPKTTPSTFVGQSEDPHPDSWLRPGFVLSDSDARISPPASRGAPGPASGVVGAGPGRPACCGGWDPGASSAGAGVPRHGQRRRVTLVEECLSLAARSSGPPKRLLFHFPGGLLSSSPRRVSLCAWQVLPQEQPLVRFCCHL